MTNKPQPSLIRIVNQALGAWVEGESVKIVFEDPDAVVTMYTMGDDRRIRIDVRLKENH